VLFEGTGNVLQESANFFWDNTNARLGIGTASPAYGLDVRSTSNIQVSSGSYASALRVENTGSASVDFKNVATFIGNRGNAANIDDNTNIGIQQKNNTANNYAVINFFNSAFNLSAFLGTQFVNHASPTAHLILGTANSGTVTEKMRIVSNGNVLIGTTTDAGFKLEVNGTTKTGDITIGSIGGSNVITFGGGNNQIYRDIADNSLNYKNVLGATTVHRFRTNSDLPNTNTTGTNVFVSLPIGFAPTSGTGTWTQLSMTHTINQTGGANGITRGLYINPTLTAAADYRAIETTVGNVMLNTTSGNTLIGTTTNSTFKLDVTGTGRFTGVLTPENNINLYSTGTAVKTIGAYWGSTPVYGLNIQGNAGSLSGTGAAPNGYIVRLGSGFSIATTDVVDIDNVRVSAGTFNPTSGSTRLNLLSIISTINQTGTATGITRGLYINPTVTAAADFRAIEVASGITVLGAATTAKASLRIPSGTAPTSPVNGDIWFDGTDIKMRIGGVTKTFTLI
jgi:hypothetical protein